jgi:hypothetical protein
MVQGRKGLRVGPPSADVHPDTAVALETLVVGDSDNRP